MDVLYLNVGNNAKKTKSLNISYAKKFPTLRVKIHRIIYFLVY